MRQPTSAILIKRLLCLLSGLLIFCAPLMAQDAADASTDASNQLPTLEEMLTKLPTAEELIKADSTKPFDWVVLNNGSVLVTEALYPRPDTLAKMAEERAQLQAARGGSSEEISKRNTRKTELRFLKIVLLDDPTEDYTLTVSEVERVISFEELMLRRADLLMEEGEIAKAYDLLLLVDRNVPGWAPTAPRFDQLLLRESQLKFKENDHYAALALLDELTARNPENQELPRQLGSIVDGLVKTSLESEDYARARYFIGRLTKHFPKHPVATGWQDRMRHRMNELMDQAAQLASSGKHAEAANIAVQADAVWNITGNQRAAYSGFVSRYQRLRVPVRDFSGGQVVSPVPLEADLRHEELTTVKLFEPYAADELTYFQSSFFDLWDPQDLGREVVFSIRQTRPYWQSQPILTANQIADALSDQLNSDLPSFNPRLASFIKAFAVRSPTELHVSFTRVPLNLEALFRFPVKGIPEDSTASVHDASRELLSRRFALVEETEDRRVFRRTDPEPDGLIPTQYHVAEVVEQKYPDRHADLQAYTRGEVDILPHLRPWEIDIIRQTEQSFVQQYALPQTHVLVFNPLSTAVENPQIRRALSFGVDRESLLKKVILRDPDMKYGRPAKAPWHSESYANSPLVTVPKYDMYLAYLLRLAALEKLKIPLKQQFVAEAKAKALAAKEDWDEQLFRLDKAQEIAASAAHITLPVLRMVVDSDEVAVLAADQMVTRWKALGFEIEMIPADRAGQTLTDDEWDFMYRSIRMQEPLLDLWSLMLTDDQFDVTRLANYPDWMRQELINLDYATSFLNAQQRLFTIHRHIAAQAFIVPLWELDDFIAFKRNVSGFQGRPLSVYHDVERWQVKP
ncbi:MAG: ABC transporter substrate-binding protein [Planctomycetaceae bacterium]